MGQILFDSRTGKYYNVQEISVTRLGGQATQSLPATPISTPTAGSIQSAPTYAMPSAPTGQTYVTTAPQHVDQSCIARVEQVQQPQSQSIEEMMGEWLTPRSTVDNQTATAGSTAIYGQGGIV